MLIHAFATMLSLLLTTQEVPVDGEAQILADLSARTRELCETRPRPANETLDACIQRRTGSLLATYGTPKDALAAAGGRPVSTSVGAMGFRTQTDTVGQENVKTVAAPSPEPRSVTCRQEVVQSPDGRSMSASLVCGNSGEGEQQALEPLDDAPRDDD